MATYVTRDLSEAAFLREKGFLLTATTKKNQSVYFHFKSDGMTEEDLNKLMLDYENGLTTVEPVQFMLAMNQMRNRIYEARD